MAQARIASFSSISGILGERKKIGQPVNADLRGWKKGGGAVLDGTTAATTVLRVATWAVVLEFNRMGFDNGSA